MTHPLPDKTRAFIIAMRKRGLTYSAIQRELHLTKGQVAGVVWRAGLCKKKEPRHDHSRVA